VGAWGAGIFDNDTACDFATEVVASRDLSVLEGTFDRVLAAGSDDLEAPDAEEALAAADIVARMRGQLNAPTAYTVEIDQWVERVKLSPGEQLVDKARRSIERILAEPSELLELWRESNDFESWKRSVEDLSERL
jgi:hypothetical protein